MVHNFNVLTVLTGAEKDLNKQVLLAFSSLFSLMSSYYLIKPLRKGFYFSEFSAELLPYFHLGAIVLIVATTAVMVKVFNKDNSSNSARSFLVLVALINIISGLLLLSPNKLNVAWFCLWSSIYFPLSLALYWGGVNQVFDAKGSKSSYAFIWIGAILGALCGSYLTVIMNKYIHNLHWGYQFLFSTIFMVFAILLFQKLICFSPINRLNNIPSENRNLESGRLFQMVCSLFKNPYLAAMTIIIFSVTFSRGVFDLESDAIIEREISSSLYQTHFSEINRIVSENDDDQKINSRLFEFIFSYKNLSSKLQNEAFSSMQSEMSFNIEKSDFDKKYEIYRQSLKREITLFNSQIWTYQNSISLAFLLVCKIQFISKIGIRPLMMCLPLTYVAVFIILFTPVGLREIFVLKILTLSLDYSLHNTAKEILYVPLGKTVNIGYKPIIEGPVYKLGAASSSAYKIIIDTLLQAASSTHLVSQLFLATATFVAIYWAKAASELSNKFKSIKSS